MKIPIRPACIHRTRFHGSMLLLGLLTSLVQAYEDAPIEYSTAEPRNRITRLAQELESGQKKLPHDARFGYLPALLRELEIPVSSQVLVFSQTSIQRPKISPQKPRAIYFTDDLYVGFVQDGLLEIAVANPALGVVFYTAGQQAEDGLRFQRGLNQCLTCHGALKTRNVPGVQVRSLFVDELGEPIVSLGTFRVNHATPFENRWGGWYVTGTHGAQKHFGNLVAPTAKRRADIDNSAGHNVTDLRGRVDLAPYLAPHSDLVALLVLEHQVDAQNLITRANFETREALHAVQQAREKGEDLALTQQRATQRIETAGEELVRYLLLSGEPALTERWRGTSTFAEDFAARGPRDRQGRSLRELDLQRRLFKYPCSYEVYSESFQALPPEMRAFLVRRFREVLSGSDSSPPFAHLSGADRQNIREILNETLPHFLSGSPSAETPHP